MVASLAMIKIQIVLKDIWQACHAVVDVKTTRQHLPLIRVGGGATMELAARLVLVVAAMHVMIKTQIAMVATLHNLIARVPVWRLPQ
jgi:hypothetical protein